MAQFPGDIQYADVSPSGRIPAVEARMPATGGLEAIGGALQQLGQKIDAQESAVELSQRKRQIEEKGHAVFNSLTADPEANEKAWQKYEQETSAIVGQSKRGNVQRALQIHVNGQIPQWREAFDKRGLAIRKKNAADQFKFEYTTLLGRGDVGGAAQVLETAKATDAMSEQEYQHYATNMFTDSALEMANVDIREGRLQQAIKSLTTFKEGTLNPDQLEKQNKYLLLAKQTQAGADDVFGKQILKEMVDFNNVPPLDKTTKAADMKQRILNPNNGLSLEQSRTLLTNIDKWEKGEDRTNNSLSYTDLFRKVTQLKRGIGQTSQVRQSILENYPNLDDQHFESLNKYLDETVEGWNADVLRRLEKEAMPHLAPRLSMLERFMELAATPGISLQEKAKYDSLIERLQEPAKVDANRLALYLDQARKWIGSNPDATNFYENGRRMLGTFEKYTDEQINQMEKNLEQLGSVAIVAPSQKNWKYTAVNKQTGERIGSDDQITWTPIQ